MPRPLMQLGVGQLEDMFGSCRGNLQVLRQLENELQHRQVPRALALLEKVQAAIATSGDAPKEPPSRAPTVPSPPSPPAPAPPKQPELWSQAPAPLVPPVRPPPSSTVAVVSAPQPPLPTPPVSTADAPVAPKLAAPALPTMPVEDAYKLLKASAGSTWESIEQTRRQLVQLAHPSRVKSLSPERRAQFLADARRVNSAYAVLATHRVRGA